MSSPIMRQVSLLFTLLLIGGAVSQLVQDDDDYDFSGSGSGDYMAIPTLYPYDPIDEDCSGKMYPMSKHCNNTERRLKCHDSYQDRNYQASHLGKKAHYTCPHTCVSVHQEMCRGINWCGEYQECNKDLKCYTSRGIIITAGLEVIMMPSLTFWIEVMRTRIAFPRGPVMKLINHGLNIVT